VKITRFLKFEYNGKKYIKHYNCFAKRKGYVYCIGMTSMSMSIELVGRYSRGIVPG